MAIHIRRREFIGTLLARPGGNVTGLSVLAPDLAGKRLELLREVVPSLRRLAFLANVSNPINEPEMREAQAAASTLGLDVVTLEIRRPEDIAPAFETLTGLAARRRSGVSNSPNGLLRNIE
jgi:putative ABC transport system substrate-binding protein